MILVVGERRFLDLGPVEAFGSFMAQLRVHEAVYQL